MSPAHFTCLHGPSAEGIVAVCRTIEYMSPELLHNGYEGKDGKTSPYDPRSTGKLAAHTAG